MANVEIDAAELEELRRLQGIVGKITANPASRKLMQQSIKAADPSVVIPEIDAVQPVNDEIRKLTEQNAAILKQFEEDKAARAEERRLAEFRNQWEGQKSQLRADGFTDEGIAAIEKHAQERGIADLEIAAAHYERLHPPAAPAETRGGFNTWDFFDNSGRDNDDFVKNLLESRGEDEGLVAREAFKALNDYRKAPRR